MTCRTKKLNKEYYGETFTGYLLLTVELEVALDNIILVLLVKSVQLGHALKAIPFTAISESDKAMPFTGTSDSDNL